MWCCSYRGYGLSQGKPTEPGLKQDAQASLDYLTTNSAVDTGNVSCAAWLHWCSVCSAVV